MRGWTRIKAFAANVRELNLDVSVSFARNFLEIPEWVKPYLEIGFFRVDSRPVHSRLMEIRLLTEHDAEAWWQLRLLGLTTDPVSFAESADEHRKKTMQEVRTFFRACSPENFVVGSFEGGELVAMAGFYRERHDKFRHKGTIWSVYVRQESRGKGIAKALLSEIIRRVRLIEGIEQINLIVSATQPVAKRVYSSLGFKHYGTEPRSLKIGDTYIDDELMVLYL